jgi:hypothetical protein
MKQIEIPALNQVSVIEPKNRFVLARLFGNEQVPCDFVPNNRATPGPCA